MDSQDAGEQAPAERKDYFTPEAIKALALKTRYVQDFNRGVALLGSFGAQHYDGKPAAAYMNLF